MRALSTSTSTFTSVENRPLVNCLTPQLQKGIRIQSLCFTLSGRSIIYLEMSTFCSGVIRRVLV